MESITYVVEASALIEGVHFLKQSIYEGKIRLLIPTCTLQSLEKAAKASLATKEESKQQIAKPTGGRAKIEYPLFDINPRTAWELVERARLGKETIDVLFQQENEVFTQWKNEEEKEAVKEELTLPPPISFADALLRNPTIKENGKQSQAPGKPKLIAKPKDQKTVWKIDKAPTLSASGLTANDKALLSCILWRVHEAQGDPLQPVKYVLLANEQGIKKKSQSFELASITVDLLRTELKKAQETQDKRNIKGQLEEDFPEILILSKALDTVDDLDSTPANLEFLQSNGDTVNHEAQNAPTVTTDTIANGEGNAFAMTSPVVKHEVSETKLVNGAKVTEQIVQTEPAPPISHESARPPQSKPGSESELDSDEEIIVFNPRNRRTSGHPGSSSRPGSSAGVIQKFYKAGIQTNISHAAPPTPSTPEPQTPRTRAESADNVWSDCLVQSPGPSDTMKMASQSGIKSPTSDSKLKAQSPVFTPGQPFPLISTSTSVVPVAPQIPEANNSRPPMGPKNTSSRPQRGGILSRPDNHDLVRMQRENSQRMIQRQREAIQRQSQNIAAHPKSPAPAPASPRLIQMEPTDSPTIIDPDAFDRTYIVQAPSVPSNTMPRQNGNKRYARGSHYRGQGRERPQSSNGHPAEPDTDFVLKSGTPRGATHEKGKLWVP